jgi:acyl carrier protein
MAFKVTLNGANYVSEERQAAFERSLETPAPVATQPVSAQAVSAAPGSKGNGGNGGNGHSPAPAGASTPSAGGQAMPEAPQAAPVHTAVDLTRVLDGLQWGLARSYDHQSETLQVHQHYLANEATYASIFAQLMREQSSLFANGGSGSDAVARVLETLSRSMEQFHHHQSESLSAHSQFLAQQAAYAESFVDVLRNQYAAALSGAGHTNGNGNGGNGHTEPVAHRGAPASTVAPLPPQSQQRRAAPHMPEPTTPVTSPRVAAPQPVVPPVPAPAAAVPVAAPVAAVQAPDPAPAPSKPALSQDLLAIVSEKTGYPAEMLELEMDMEADLGIDSIKRVEILGALQDMHPELPEVETDALAELRTLAEVVAYTEARSGAPVTPALGQPTPPSEVLPAADVESGTEVVGGLLSDLSEDLLQIVSEKTGYPAEMLELEMDMEADLGIDSIKRVEILGALQDMHPELPEVETDALAELRTLAQVLGYVEGKAAPVPVLADGGNAKKG